MGLMGLMGGCGEVPKEDAPPPPRSWQSITPPSSQDSKGREFWLAFQQNLSTAELTLFITSAEATTGRVEIPGLGFSTVFTISPGQVTPVEIPSEAELATADGVENKGIHVTADHEITIYGLNRVLYTTDAYLGLPTDILGTDYVVLGYGNVNLLNGTQFSVVATEPDTQVTITPKAPTTTHPVGVPYTLTLQQGQTYQFRSTAPAPADVSGTIITSNKPIAVFGGHQCANIPDGMTGACDNIVEQIPPTTTWGKSFVTVPLATRMRGDTFRFLASTDGTQVTVNGTVVANLNRGQVHQMLITGMAHITSTQPLLVAQYSNGSSFDGVTSDPFMMLIPPYEQFLPGYTVTTPASGFVTNFINVVVPNAATNALKLDGVLVPESRFTPIGASGFSGAQLAVALGSHSLVAPLPFGVFMYGFDYYDSYGYPGGASLSPIAVATTLTVAPKTGSSLIHAEHCLTATVLDQNGDVVEGVRVDWKVSGANTVTGFGNTDASGQNVFCYRGVQGGNDSIVASVGTLADNATWQWIANQAPVARCRNVAVQAGETCGGVDASVNDGSYDPDPEDTLSCVQTPSGAYSVGSRLVTLTCTDDSGLSSSCTATVTVMDTTAPVLTCPEPVTAECTGNGAATVTRPNASAVDSCGGTPVVTGGGSASYPLGTTTTTYSATDTAGNTATCNSSVTVRDTQPPAVSLLGYNGLKVECGSTYTDPGAIATDVCVGDLTRAITTLGSVNPAVVGSYSISYGVRDPSGNAASASRSVSVQDTLAPVLGLTGQPSLSHECGTPYMDPGAFATDVCSGDLTGAIVTQNGVDASAPGTYTVQYDVADQVGLTATGVRTVNVQDTLAPELTVLPGPSVIECGGAPYVDPGATALDVCGGDLTASIQRSSTLDGSKPGSYSVTYQVTDPSGHTSTATRPLRVVDSQAPSLSMTQVDMWPPNHSMHSFTLADCVSVHEVCDSTLDINAAGTITSIYSDEPEDVTGNGDGHTVGDIALTGTSSFQLRAERQGKGNGRVYGVNFQVKDASGNTSQGTCLFTVPHDQSGAAAVNDGPGSGYSVLRSIASTQ
jgi:hypothetical protein